MSASAKGMQTHPFDGSRPIVYSSPEIDAALKAAGIPKAWIRFTPHESGRPNRWRMDVVRPGNGA